MRIWYAEAYCPSTGCAKYKFEITKGDISDSCIRVHAEIIGKVDHNSISKFNNSSCDTQETVTMENANLQENLSFEFPKSFWAEYNAFECQRRLSKGWTEVFRNHLSSINLRCEIVFDDNKLLKGHLDCSPLNVQVTVIGQVKCCKKPDIPKTVEVEKKVDDDFFLNGITNLRLELS